MSSDLTPEEFPSPPAFSGPSPHTVEIEGRTVLVPVMKDASLIRDRSRSMYVRYPDGSMRRATPKRSLDALGRKGVHARTRQRELSAAHRFVDYVAPKMTQPLAAPASEDLEAAESTEGREEA